MIAKKFKLPLEAFLKEKGKRRFDLPLFTVFVRPNGLENNRVGVTLSAKLEKRSVKRHAVSRLLFRAARGWPSKGLDVNIVGRAPLFAANRQEIEDELNHFVSSSF
jgi:ribonuclease P protein component